MNFDMAGIKVMICIPSHRDFPPQTVNSLMETQALVLERGMTFDCVIMAGSSLAHHARTKCAHHFLKSDCNRLFWIDSDISWKATDFLRLVALSTKMECVSGIYCSKADPPQFFMQLPNHGGVLEANEYGCLPLHGLGLGFTCVQRKIIEELAERAPKLRFHDIPDPIPSIFRCDDSDGDARGEDMAFFSDVRALGYRINLDPTISLGHIGPKEFRADFADSIISTQGDLDGAS